MRIGINGYEAVVPRFGFSSNGLPNRVGSSEVCFEILCELAKIDSKNRYVVYLPVKPSSDMPKESSVWQYRVLPGKFLWTILSLRSVIRKEKFDVFFSPTHYAPIFIKCPQVISVLDVSYKYFPQLFKKKDLFKLNLWGGYSIRKAEKIITISNSSKNDIIKEYQIDSEKISVIYPGAKQVSSIKNKVLSMREIKEKYGIAKPYILFVGTLQPRKNLVSLIEAFARLKAEDLKLKDLKLLIIGRRGWDYKETLAAPEKFEVASQVRFLENVGDNELSAFYENAQLFVLPSLYEGFGLPILEAMKYGCPVVTSNVSSMPEAGGDAAVYFDPNDVSDIADKIGKVLKDGKLRKKMIRKGHEQVEKFSWEKSAKEVLGILEKAGGKNV